MTINTQVKYFNSSMTGAPVLSASAGSLINILDACLVNGFGNVTITSLVILSNIATATTNTNHNFTMVGNCGKVIEISGATPSTLNIQWRIQSILNSTQFTFTTSGISDQTASGTILAKLAPAGFSKSFTDTNKAVYQSNDITGTRLYLQINDTSEPALIRGYETMSDVNTGTNGFPTSTQKTNGVYTYKSYSSIWTLISDGKMVYFLTDLSTYQGLLFFGDIINFKSNDAFHSVVCGANGSDINLFVSRTDGNGIYGCFIARSHTQLGTSINFTRKVHVSQAARIGSVGLIPFPNPVDNSLALYSVECWDTSLRGVMPGLYSQIHSIIPNNNSVFTISEKTFILKLGYDYGGTCSYTFDISGPWR